MKELILKVVSNKAVRGAFVTLVLAIAAALGLVGSAGCAALGEFKPGARDVLECQLATLRPHLGDAALELAKGARDGKLSEDDAKAALSKLPDLKASELAAVVAQLRACSK